uniref:BRCT domain-containing protein n=1 Tax=Panagrellus redivivus TaxID=6233 RepID=A0A7E4VVS0_PANRE
MANFEELYNIEKAKTAKQQLTIEKLTKENKELTEQLNRRSLKTKSNEPMQPSRPPKLPKTTLEQKDEMWEKRYTDYKAKTEEKLDKAQQNLEEANLASTQFVELNGCCCLREFLKTARAKAPIPRKRGNETEDPEDSMRNRVVEQCQSTGFGKLRVGTSWMTAETFGDTIAAVYKKANDFVHARDIATTVLIPSWLQGDAFRCVERLAKEHKVTLTRSFR